MNSKLNMTGWKVSRLTPSRVDTPEGSISVSWNSNSDGGERDRKAEEAARLIAAAPELLAELQRAQEFIDSISQELHQRRVADWYPEGAHNAADQMSEDMRLLGNACVDFDTSAVIAKATGESA